MVSVNYSQNSTVLAALRQTNKDIATTQTRIGTGYKINSASDNASLWATVQSIRSDLKTADTKTANMSIAKSQADAAVNGLNKINDLLVKMQEVSDATDAAATGSALTTAVNKITSYQAQITAIVNASAFKGKNFLTTAATQTVAIGTDASNAAVNASVDTINVLDTGTDLKLAAAGSTATIGAVKLISGLATTAMTYVANYQATLSSFSEGLDFQLDFQSSLKSIKESALSGIVDADMEAEAAKLTALQTKQQLAYQALSITNSSSQNILRLFQ